jgi:hypothetical protein
MSTITTLATMATSEQSLSPKMVKLQRTRKSDSGHCPCSRNRTRTHEYFADPVRLYHIVCRYGCGSCGDSSRHWKKSNSNDERDDDDDDNNNNDDEDHAEDNEEDSDDHHRPIQREATANAVVSTQFQQANHVTYLRARRNTKQVLGLLSMAAPLDESSTKVLREQVQQCGITINSAMPHLILAEGLWSGNHRPLRELAALRQALQQHSTLIVEDIHRILPLHSSSSDETTRGRHRSHRRIIVANVSVHATVQHAIDQLVLGDGCVLPPFPLHVTLGYIGNRTGGGVDHDGDDDAVQDLAVKSMVGMSLTIMADRIRILAPMDFDAWSPWYEVDHNDYGVVEKFKKETSVVTRKAR